jgi:starvation-inducible outer membrane lipoprotein
MLQDALRAGKRFTLECELFPGETQPCGSIIAAMKPDDLESVERCDSDDWETVCQRLKIGGRVIRVLTTRFRKPGPPPGEIVSARLTSEIRFGETIVD